MSKEAHAAVGSAQLQIDKRKSAVYPAPHDHEHWRAWEDAALITMLSEANDGGEAWTLETVAERLGRTPGAVSERYDDLIAGRTECPDGYQERLRRLRAKIHFKAAPQTPLVITGPGGQYCRLVEDRSPAQRRVLKNRLRFLRPQPAAKRHATETQRAQRA